MLTPDGSRLRGRHLELLEQDSPLVGLSPQEQDVLHNLLQRARIRH